MFEFKWVHVIFIHSLPRSWRQVLTCFRIVNASNQRGSAWECLNDLWRNKVKRQNMDCRKLWCSKKFWVFMPEWVDSCLSCLDSKPQKFCSWDTVWYCPFMSIHFYSPMRVFPCISPWWNILAKPSHSFHRHASHDRPRRVVPRPLNVARFNRQLGQLYCHDSVFILELLLIAYSFMEHVSYSRLLKIIIYSDDTYWEYLIDNILLDY